VNADASRPGSDRLSISELAGLAGVTPRAVRHYHSIGLLPEPARDTSGYRRYGGRDVVALVRIVRLRAIGMPLPLIAERMDSAGDDDVSLPGALRALADDLDAEIKNLSATRDHLRELASSTTFEQPVRTLTQALRSYGLLGPGDELRAGESWAATLVDALHPQGMAGVLDEASGLLANPATLSALSTLRQRFRALTGRSSDEEIRALVNEVVQALPSGTGEEKLLDLDMVEKLLSDRLTRAQRRFMHLLREELVGGKS
jgi:DNA-binding transcriptional MerR regulator